MPLQFNSWRKVSHNIIHINNLHIIPVSLKFIHYVAPNTGPTNVSGTAINSETIILTWSPPPFDQQNGFIRYYTVNVTELDTGYDFFQTTTGTELIIYSLHPYYTYEFELSAVTVSEGPSSAPIAVQTEQDGKEIKVTSLYNIIVLNVATV